MSKDSRPLVTVYVTCHNYGRFLKEALESVMSQTLESWEMFVMNDGSTDNSEEIAQRFAANPDKPIEVISTVEPRGLRVCANDAINRARGKYVVRLDADDYFDENALLVLSHYLETHPEVGLVYPNWTYIDEDGSFMGIENRARIGEEDQVKDLPAHGACTMVRRRVLKSVGGYDPTYDSQDGHELWLKVLHRWGVGNVATPLFYYRQHGSSMSRNERRLLGARQKIKRGMAAKQEGHIKPRILAVIPAKNTYRDLPNVVMQDVGGRPLIDHTIEAAKQSNIFESIYVSTDDDVVAQHCIAQGVLADLRPRNLSSTRTTLSDVLSHAVETVERNENIYADIVILLSVHSPLRRAEHIQKAVDTLALYDVDNVISVYEDFDIHFVHGRKGLTPVNPGILKTLRFEREALFVDNGAIHAFWRDFVSPQDLYRGKIGHIVMPRADSIQIKSQADLDLVKLILTK